jgi:hypothetical protein
MTCKYLDQSPDRKEACKLQEGVCIDWLIWYAGSEEPPKDSDEFCLCQGDNNHGAQRSGGAPLL